VCKYVVHDHYQLVAVDISYRENSKENFLSYWVRNRSLRSDSDNLEKAGAALKHLGPFVAVCTACCNPKNLCIQPYTVLMYCVVFLQ